MNERIRELCIKAGAAPLPGSIGLFINALDPQKFAELIVKECAEYLSTTDYSDVAGDHNRALEIAAIDLLELFGVE